LSNTSPGQANPPASPLWSLIFKNELLISIIFRFWNSGLRVNYKPPIPVFLPNVVHIGSAIAFPLHPVLNVLSLSLLHLHFLLLPLRRQLMSLKPYQTQEPTPPASSGHLPTKSLTFGFRWEVSSPETLYHPHRRP
jgi:hypothetical protein